MSLESDPTRRIVDFDTFALWVMGYKDKVVRQAEKREAIAVFDVADLDSEHHDLFDLALDRYPWESIPQSIQEIIAMQYGAASVDERKDVDIHVDKYDISFILRSPSIVDLDFDAYSEIYVHPGGLKLKMVDMGRLKRGEWAIMKRPITEGELEARDFARTEIVPLFEVGLEPNQETLDKYTELRGRGASMELTTFPATLPQLHDVVRLLENNRDRIVVAKIIV